MRYNDLLEPVEDTRLSTKLKISIIIGIIGWLFFGVNLWYTHTVEYKVQCVEHIIAEEVTIEKDSTLTVQNVWDYSTSLNIKFPHIFVAQVVVESGWDINSELSIYKNNICGMRQAKQRPTTNIPNNSQWGKFRNWKECVIDYALLQSKYFRGQTENEYYQWLESYASDPEYINKLKSTADKIMQDYGMF